MIRAVICRVARLPRAMLKRGDIWATAFQHGFFYTKYTENNPCGACTYADDGYVCMNLEEGAEMQKKLLEKVFGNERAVCSPCENFDFDSHECRCLKGQCTKIPK